ncbi:MAG: hypothetical protein FWD57_16185 [Polyangiaceae bacterium]|nr:hypothetical protein [Polyangiaceae bacterium]
MMHESLGGGFESALHLKRKPVDFPRSALVSRRDDHIVCKPFTAVVGNDAHVGVATGNDALTENADQVEEAPSYLRDLHAELDDMKDLLDNWDDEGASRPADTSIARAHELLRWIEEAGLHKFDVSVGPDVLGGIAIWIRRDANTKVWIACMDERDDTVVFQANKQFESALWQDHEKAAVSKFLLGGSRA